MFWLLMKHVILGPLLRVAYRPRVTGAENVPSSGPAVLASNHLSYLDSLLLPLVVPRRKVVFLAKSLFVEKWYLGWFLRGAGVIPVSTAAGDGEAAVKAAIEALKMGRLVGVFPEGTRSPDGCLYRGRTGVARMALQARVPVIPVGIRGTFQAMPAGATMPRSSRVDISFGQPLRFDRYFDRAADRLVVRAVTDEVMREIAALSGQQYVDEYAARSKRRLALAAGSAET